MRRLAAACAVIAASFVASSVPAWAASATAEDATGYLASQQRPNGAFGSDNQPADQLAEAIAALAVADADPGILERSLSLLSTRGPERADEQAAYAARIIIGLVAARQDPRAFGGKDYVAAVSSRYNPVLAAYGGNLYAEGLAGLGLAVANEPVPAAFRDRLIAGMCASGGWSWRDRCGAAPDADTTSVILSALALTGSDASSVPVAKSLDWLRSIQASSGAFPLEAGAKSNSNSTGLVAVALATLGEDPRSFGGKDVVASLDRFATAEGGFAYLEGGAVNLYSTIQALPGALASAHPFAPRPDPPDPGQGGPVPTVVPVPSTLPSVTVPPLPSALPSLTVASRREAAGEEAAAPAQPVAERQADPDQPGWLPASMLLGLASAAQLYALRSRRRAG